MLGYSEEIERVSLAQPVIQTAIKFQRVGVTGGYDLVVPSFLIYPREVAQRVSLAVPVT